MTIDSVREYCLSLPHATEIMQWGDHVLFKVGGKMFCILSLEGPSLSLKCTPETYAELVERPGVSPSGYNMWKYQWVALDSLNALYDSELRELIAISYQLVHDKLPKKIKQELASEKMPGRRPAKSKKKR